MKYTAPSLQKQGNMNLLKPLELMLSLKEFYIVIGLKLKQNNI